MLSTPRWNSVQVVEIEANRMGYQSGEVAPEAESPHSSSSRAPAVPLSIFNLQIIITSDNVNLSDVDTAPLKV